MLLPIFLLSLFTNYQNMVNGANILALMNIPSPSHSLWNTILVNALANRGHNLTVLISDLPKNPKDLHKNVHFIDMNDMYQNLFNEADFESFLDISPLQMMSGYCMYNILVCEATLKSKGFSLFMEKYKNEKFDLILYDYTFGPCLLGLVHMYNYPPLISVSAFPYVPIATKFTGGHFYPAYVSYHSVTWDPINNFLDRMHNHMLYAAEELYRYYSMNPQLDKMIRPVFPADTPYLADLEKLTTIALIGTHPAITKAQPLPQNIIEVGGLNIVDSQPLPKELDSFINSSKKGAIFFSLGTNVQPKFVKSEMIENILKVMEKFPEYNFMWKFDVNLIKMKIPKNVLVQTFFPQRDILANKKTKCFITHAGGLSTQEAIWFGVPMITVPVFVDQLRNSQKVVEDGIATEINFSKFTGESFHNALNDILHNEKYINNIKKQSEIFKDRPMKPLDTAIWWIEYVLRHPNPTHLKVPTLELGYFIANSYDFISIVLLIVIFILYVTIKIIKCICRGKARKTEKQKLKKK
ncbi:UDP-glucosyltransferase 2-like [Condylostylus longicornis]|uniref:UDP-glucosyltransferase 2-like n=1 Tax=Condylostylus longicornis TaxID=2530218 RepID=UPI00244DE7EA|nr:UDP-glucosyltransferase 2-like [Condylostylus longicornis]XP_055376140.1 UDP-glucosyltransferase 2-like [Condylostylus longicornis]